MPHRSLASRASVSASVSLTVSVTFLLAAAGAGCSSNSPATFDGGTGSPVVGAMDTHCSGVTPVVLNPASCNVGPDAGTSDPDGGVPEPPAPTLFNAEGDDDDCKYHVKFSVSPAPHVNQNVTFKMTLTKLADGSPATGAIDANGNGVTIEGTLESDDTHVLPNPTPATKVTETPSGSGIYTITPINFDSSGRWIVRFHVFENCLDELEDSQHGHVAFFFDMP